MLLKMLFKLLFFDNFDLYDVRNKIKKNRKNIILIHFQLKSTFEKHFVPHYQIYTKKRREKPEKKEKYVIFNQFIKTHHNVKNYMYIVKSKITNN